MLVLFGVTMVLRSTIFKVFQVPLCVITGFLENQNQRQNGRHQSELKQNIIWQVHTSENEVSVGTKEGKLVPTGVSTYLRGFISL